MAVLDQNWAGLTIVHLLITVKWQLGPSSRASHSGYTISAGFRGANDDLKKTNGRD